MNQSSMKRLLIASLAALVVMGLLAFASAYIPGAKNMTSGALGHVDPVNSLVTAIAMAQMPAVVGLTYEHSALAAGDGRGFFLLQAARATVQTLAFLIGVQLGGLGGAGQSEGTCDQAAGDDCRNCETLHGVTPYVFGSFAA